MVYLTQPIQAPWITNHHDMQSYAAIALRHSAAYFLLGVMALARVFSPQSESEVLVATALLEAYGIPVFVHGRGIGSILPGIQINAYNTQSIMVPEECAVEAVALLAQLEKSEGETAAETMRFRDKVRIVLEGLLFGWFVPGSRSRSRDEGGHDA